MMRRFSVLNVVAVREWCQACTFCQMRRWLPGQEMLLSFYAVAHR